MHFLWNHRRTKLCVITVGAPLSPSLRFSVFDELTVGVEWDEPFTWDDFPVTRYTVEVVDGTSGEMIENSTLSPTNRFFNVTPQACCSDLTFSVRAWNSVGASTPGTTTGAFPSSIIIHNNYEQFSDQRQR